MRAPSSVLLAALAALALAGGAAGARGVSIDLGRIDIEQALTPGGAYTLPTFGVRNPGDETTTYELVANPVEDAERRAPPPDWVRFDPGELTLEPGESATVGARIVLPTDAEPGDYIALVGAQIVTKGKGAQVGAAAAARTTFTVEPASTLQAWWLNLKTLFDDHAPWSWLAPLIAAAAALAWLLPRRFSFRVERRPA